MDTQEAELLKNPTRAVPLTVVSKSTKSNPKTDAPSKPKTPFISNAKGLYFQSEDMDAPMWIGGRLDILAKSRDGSGDHWGLWVQFDDPDGIVKTRNIPAEQLSGDSGSEIVRGLLRQGYRLASGPKARQKLLDYLQQTDTRKRAKIVRTLGWHDGAFLLPERVIGTTPEALIFEGTHRLSQVVKPVGELEQWQKNIATLCSGNSRLVFSVSAAFAGPLLHLTDTESGGVHFVGDSSLGKTVLLRVAASVWGSPSFKSSWRATSNGLEGLSAAHSDSILLLDEISQATGEEVAQSAYMLANATGKVRAHANGDARDKVEWRLIFLSNGEKSLADHLAETKNKTSLKAGQEVRMLNVRADAGAGHGLFENLHGHPDSFSLVKNLELVCTNYYGTAAPAFLEKLVPYSSLVASEFKQWLDQFKLDYAPEKASGQVYRAATRFALIGYAGELATRWGLTGWSSNEAWLAAGTMFRAWLTIRGSAGNLEHQQMLSGVRLFLERHGEDMFARWPESRSALDEHQPDETKTPADTHAPKTLNMMGFRRYENQMVQFVIFPESFKFELCRGFAYLDVCRVLDELGALDKTKGRGFLKKFKNVPGRGPMDCYVINSNLWRASDD